MNYVIEELNGQHFWEGKYGKNVDLTMTLVDIPNQVVLTQKADRPFPKAGETLDLSLEPYSPEEVQKYPPKANLLRAKRPQQAGMFGLRPEDPKRSAAIQRMHSQEIAVRTLRTAMEFAILKENERPQDLEAFLKLMRRTADWLDKDVQRVRDAVA
jgi:hypothetical protein